MTYPSVCQNCNVKSYVDDSKLYVSFSNKDVNGGLDKLRQVLSRIASWCGENRLLIKPGKTEFCVFGSNRMLTQTSIPPIMFIGKKLTIKDPGVIIDKHLSFNEHTDALASELMRKLVIISRICHLFDKSTLFIMINLLIFQTILLFLHLVRH